MKHNSPNPEKGNTPPQPWSRSWKEIVVDLDVSIENGLPVQEIPVRMKTYGQNVLREIKGQSAWGILINQFKNLIVGFLLAASFLSFLFHEYVEGVAIGAVILINALIGFLTELKGARSIEALRKLGSVQSRVRRDGTLHEISAEMLVPGDIVILEGGDIITADLRLISGSRLEADESVLTGESLPVVKNPEPVEAGAVLAERTNMLFKGTALTRGAGEAVVVGTGMHTELGKISSLVAETEDEVTPLEKRLDELGHKLIWVCLGLAAFVAISGIMAGKDLFLMIETAIALAVASVPEGLPIVATIALGRGMWRMARRNALIKVLSAVETLGATSVICTDKTGTLTENRLTVTTYVVSDGVIEIGNGLQQDFSVGDTAVLPEPGTPLYQVLEIGVLCNNASYVAEDKVTEKAKSVGDPLEVALLAVAERAGMTRFDLSAERKEVREEAFDAVTKMMATFHEQEEDGYLVAVKGAPEAVFDACTHFPSRKGEGQDYPAERQAWQQENDRLARQGLRVLALARKTVSDLEANPYEDLQLIGLVGCMDPPRQDVKEALSMCREAGVRVVMVTGDQAVTARTIALAVGLVTDENAPVVEGRDLKKAAQLSEAEKRALVDVTLFARVSPEQKLDLIDIHRQFGAIVAMTGDGVNDAPALKKADIGIAMGKRGTQVAREASDMILKDDAFSTIVHAIEQGRVIFNNIRKFVLYLLSCNLSEIMVVTLASIISMPLPILPLQILFLNIVTDVFPALALAAGESNEGIMKLPPRDRDEAIIKKQHWVLVMVYGLVITVAVLGALALALFWLGMDTSHAVSVSFLTLAFAQLWHVLNMRDPSANFWNNVVTRNPFIWGALALCSALLVATVYLPGLSNILKVENPGLSGWILVMVMSFLPALVGGFINRAVLGRRT